MQYDASLAPMKVHKITQLPQATTRDLLSAQCDEAEKNIRLFKKWVEATPWLDQTTVDLAMPWFLFVCLESASKPLVLAKLGEEKWKVEMSGEIRKATQGIIVAVAG
jgi:hypothetical protein